MLDPGDLDAMLRHAQEGTYRFPAGFAGFTARLLLVWEGGEAEGQVTALDPSKVEVHLEGPEPDREWASRELASLIAHRWPQTYESGDGRYPKESDPDDCHPLGTLIKLRGDPLSSSYRVRDGQVTQINRHVGNGRFSIVIQARRTAPRGHADGRGVPTQFAVCHWDGTGRLVRSDLYSDAYVEMNDLLLPERRRVVSADDQGLVAREMRLEQHSLM